MERKQPHQASNAGTRSVAACAREETRSHEPEALRPGEVELLLRALRYYVHGEQQAVSNAVLEARRTKRNKDALHAEDVRKQAQSHIDAAQALHIKLRARILKGEVVR